MRYKRSNGLQKASGDFCSEKEKENNNQMETNSYLSDEILGSKNNGILYIIKLF